MLAFAPVTPQHRAWYFDGYGPATLDPHRLAYYTCVRALEDLDLALQVLDVRQRPDTERAEALLLVRGVLSPTGMVALAQAALAEIRSPGTPDAGRRGPARHL